MKYNHFCYVRFNLINIMCKIKIKKKDKLKNTVLVNRQTEHHFLQKMFVSIGLIIGSRYYYPIALISQFKNFSVSIKIII